jgi:hypothetical protein
MLFMVIEQFKKGNVAQIGRRFQQRGRMLPPNVTYCTSWVDTSGSRCFQVMEAPHGDSLKAWTRQWEDLIDFEIVPVMTSAEFWARQSPPET